MAWVGLGSSVASIGPATVRRLAGVRSSADMAWRLAAAIAVESVRRAVAAPDVVVGQTPYVAPAVPPPAVFDISVRIFVVIDLPVLLRI